jgi:hypothetical protein
MKIFLQTFLNRCRYAPDALQPMRLIPLLSLVLVAECCERDKEHSYCTECDDVLNSVKYD